MVEKRSSNAPKAAVAARAEVGRPRAKALNTRSVDRGKQVLRLFTLLRALDSARRGLTVNELHALLEERCTLRTVYRDLEQLQNAGFMLEEEGGRYKLAESAQRISTTPLRSHEILTLLLTGDLLEPIAATTLGAAHTALRDRLMAGLTPEARGFVKEQRAALKATHGAPAQLCVAPDVLSEIEEASEREHCLRLDYATPGKTPMARVVEPHLFWVHAGRPYLVAYCRSAGELRTFALQRVTGAQMLDEPFERRADFDAQSFVEQGFGVLHGARHAFAVRFGPRGKPSAPSALAAVRRR